VVGIALMFLLVAAEPPSSLLVIATLYWVSGRLPLRAAPPPRRRAPRGRSRRGANTLTTPRPVVGVGAVVVHDGRVLLIRRGKEPLRGRWLVPGGAVEWGETLQEALVREVEEETGLVVRPRELLVVLDRIHRAAGIPAGEVEYHYVIVDYLCMGSGGCGRVRCRRPPWCGGRSAGL
jgi:ADP-ribose pyrophosphatase YjhB (NUDIX family)